MDRDEALKRRFQPLGPPGKHFWRVQKMAKATGVDLVAARETDALSQSDWAGMVTRCRSCDCVEGCARFLARAEDGKEAAPDGCMNQKRFNALRKMMDDPEA